MVSIGTPNTPSATRLLLLGSGELGREIAIASIRLGLEVIAVDRYANAPAMQVAQHSHVLSMLDGNALRSLIEREKPDLIVPEIEAIATETLLELEREGYKIIPTAHAVKQTMNREGIRRLAAELLGLPTSSYCFAGNLDEFKAAIEQIGLPCLVKPVMSSSGKGQSLLQSADQVAQAWVKAQEEGRAGQGRVIIESFVDFDYEITLLTVRHTAGVSFCEPIGHYQQDGDYRLSWQPQPMPLKTLEMARDIAARITAALGGWGVFGVELFIKNGSGGQADQVYFSEVSPRPHDTGLVTCIGQDLSEFALHLRAILGLPIPVIRQRGPAASAAILGQGNSQQPLFHDLDLALQEPDTDIMLFGKPGLSGKRRLGVALALGSTIDEAKAKAQRVAEAVRLEL